MSDVIQVTEGEFQPPVPVGEYPAVLKAYDKKTGGWGDYYSFHFEIIDPKFEGIQKNFMCSAKITKSEQKPSKLYSMIVGLGFEVGEQFDLAELIDTECKITVLNDKPKADGKVYQSVSEVKKA